MNKKDELEYQIQNIENMIMGIKSEIFWHISHPTSMESSEFKLGFLCGLNHTKNLLETHVLSLKQELDAL